MFITFEGIEGAGKSSQIPFVADWLEARGVACVTTREPGGTPIGCQIRSVLLDPKNDALEPEAELLLYIADRIQHIRSVIIPALAAGKTVLCDRYLDATVVYQGVARGLDSEMIHRIHDLVAADLLPDLTFLFDLPPAVGLSRAWKQLDDGSRVDRESRFESEHLEFHERVRNGYLHRAKQAPDRFCVIDAAGPVSDVRRQLLAVLESKMGNAL